MKRIFDVVVSGLAILLLSPLLLPVMILLRLTGEGEVFYRQERVGFGRKPFSIYKFATMLKDSPKLPGGDITVGSDPRILPVGRVLRNTKVNELPQLLNVFFGDMSLIGWRPLTPRVASLFPEAHWDALANWRPGLSGIGSLVFRDEEQLLTGVADRQTVYASVIVPYKSALEVWYTKHQSFWLDLKLIAITAGAVMGFKPDLYRIFSDLPPPPATLMQLRDVPARPQFQKA
jgi:lipopolysaccharide/colanic/teichoic acid biosynthesis glycosyltransferase